MGAKRVALVTGATGGLGTHMCKKLYDDGYLVCGNYRSREKAEKWNEEMKAEGYDIFLYPADVSDFDQVGDMIRSIEKDKGTISILINNAGITRDGAFRKMTREA